MLPYFHERFGNASSAHVVGTRAREAVEQAREHVSAVLGVARSHVVFTSGATESINLALKGAALGASGRRQQIVTVATEHKAVLDTCRSLARFGIETCVVGVAADGVPDLDALADAIGDDTIVVSVMAANNETGVLAPIREIAAIAHASGALVHCDATQAVGKVPFDMAASGVDMLSLSSHKMYGPQGVGALVVSPATARLLIPQIDGGGHEGGLRSGTLNTPGCVGFGAAAALVVDLLPDESERIARLRNHLERQLIELIDDTTVNAQQAPRLPGTSNVRFAGVDGDALVLALRDVAISTGSACTAATPTPSHVLRAMGLSYEGAQECVRFSLGRFTTQDEIVHAATATADAVAVVRDLRIRG